MPNETPGVHFISPQNLHTLPSFHDPALTTASATVLSFPMTTNREPGVSATVTVIVVQGLLSRLAEPMDTTYAVSD